MSNRITPNQREVIAAIDSVTGSQVYPTATNQKLDVNATFSASSIAIQDGVSSSIKATVASLTNSKALAVEIVDGSGTQITSFGGGTQYAEGATAATGTGTLAIWKDTAGGNTMRATSEAWPMPVDLGNGGWPAGTGNVLLNLGSPTNIGLLQNAAVANGNGNSTGSTQFDISTIVLQVVSSPSMSGGTTVNFEASTDGSTWFPIEGHKVGTIGSLQTTTTSDGIFVFDYAGLVGALGGSTGIRARISNYSAGTITVHAWGSIYPFNKNTVALATGSNTIGAVTQSGSWIVTANAGTNLNTSALALETGGNLASVATNTTNIPNVIGTAASAIPSKLLQVGGSDGTNARAIKTDTSGNVGVNVQGTVPVSGTFWQATQPVSGTVTANAGTGTFNIQSNASVNLAQLAGNTISSGVGASGTGTLRAVVANDAGRSLQSASGSASSSGNNTLVSAGTNRLKVYAFTLSTTSSTAVTCIFQSGAGGTELWRVVLQAPSSVSTGANLVVQPPAWLFATGTAALLNLNLSGAQTVHWSVSYWDEA